MVCQRITGSGWHSVIGCANANSHSFFLTSLLCAVGVRFLCLWLALNLFCIPNLARCYFCISSTQTSPTSVEECINSSLVTYVAQIQVGILKVWHLRGHKQNHDAEQRASNSFRLLCLQSNQAVILVWLNNSPTSHYESTNLKPWQVNILQAFCVTFVETFFTSGSN